MTQYLSNTLFMAVAFYLGIAMKIMEWHEDVYAKSKKEEPPDNWSELRDITIRRYHYICYRCDIRKKKCDLQLHHIKPRDKGGSDDISNLIPLCVKCHDIVEIEELHTKADIIGSYESYITTTEMKNKSCSDESFDRPEWHKYVYGGQKRSH